MSIALEVCRIAEERVGREALADVVAVGVEVGDAAGVDVESLSFCLETLLAAPPFVRATPVLCRAAGDTLRVTYLEVEDGGPAD